MSGKINEESGGKKMGEKINEKPGGKKTKLKKRLAVLVGLVAVVVVVILLTQRGGDSATESVASDTGMQEEENSEVVEESEFEKTVDLAGLEINVNSAEEKEYSISALSKTFTDTGEAIITQETITNTYQQIETMVFNPTAENKVLESIKLVDDLGNEYATDSNPEPDNGLAEFGRDMIVSPSTARQGYLFFLNVDENAKTLQLVFELESGETEVFEFER